jgi:hypothetical protein
MRGPSDHPAEAGFIVSDGGLGCEDEEFEDGGFKDARI